jgi:hypothetical protein
MKPKNKRLRLEARQKNWDQKHKDDSAFKRPGSLKK